MPEAPPTRIITGSTEWLHTVAGYGDVYRIRAEYEGETLTWIVANEYGMYIYDTEHAYIVLKSFLCHHFPNQTPELKQIQPHIFTQRLNAVIMSTKNPYPSA